jgi:polyribonucleotide nucleotidyltransferase
LGQPIEVRVEDIDPQGKVSLSLAGEFATASSDESAAPARESNASTKKASSASFEEAFEAELEAEIGDLGPGAPSFKENEGGRRPRNRQRRR